MDIDNIDIQIEWYEFQLVNLDTCDDTGQIRYELATLRFNKQRASCRMDKNHVQSLIKNLKKEFE